MGTFWYIGAPTFNLNFSVSHIYDKNKMCSVEDQCDK